MTALIVAEEHSQLYDVWIERGRRNLSVCHVDFHCDMRGLLIDRRRGRARFVWRNDPFMNRLDSGSFLAHAVMNGMVGNLRWVHDEFGGRKYDDLYCVKYESDFSALPFRFSGGGKWAPLRFTEQTFADWDGPQPGEYLSLDWDALAFAGYDEQRIRRLMAEILDREFTVEGVFLAHSLEYCHPEKALFDEFVARLEQKLKSLAVRLPNRLPPPLGPSLPWKIYHQLEHLILRKMRRRGIY
ncbi:MAG: hypothetical protein WDA20_09770 [Desulfuromonadales bacterium]